MAQSGLPAAVAAGAAAGITAYAFSRTGGPAHAKSEEAMIYNSNNSWCTDPELGGVSLHVTDRSFTRVGHTVSYTHVTVVSKSFRDFWLQREEEVTKPLQVFAFTRLRAWVWRTQMWPSS